MAYNPPPNTAWQLNTEGPGGTTNPYSFASKPGNYTFVPGSLYFFCMYQAVGPALNAMPNTLTFLEPNLQATSLLSDPEAVRITSITSSNTNIVGVTPASGQTDLAGHLTITLTSGTTPGNATITAHDENGNTATVAVSNVQTNSGVTVPGLPTSEQFTTGITADYGPFGIAPEPTVTFGSPSRAARA